MNIVERCADTAQSGVNVKYLVMGLLHNNVYVVDDGQACFVVDPTDHAPEILAALGERRLSAIVLTHCHADHMGAAAELRAATGAPVYASEIEAPWIEDTMLQESRPLRRPPSCPVDVKVADGQLVQLGGMRWRVLLTPGHTRGSMCWLLEPGAGAAADAEAAGAGSCGTPVLLSGDTLFAGAFGRTDFTGGSMVDMRRSLARLSQLPDNVLVFPGHGETTTIGAERMGVFALLA